MGEELIAPLTLRLSKPLSLHQSINNSLKKVDENEVSCPSQQNTE